MNSSFISLEYIFRIILRMTFPLLDFTEDFVIEDTFVVFFLTYFY